MALRKNQNKIAISITRALENDMRLDLLGISVDVANGRVLLKGIAPSLLQRRIAEEIVKGMGGISEVINDITVEPPISRSIQEVLQDIRDALTADDLVDESKIHIKAIDTVITLEGTVRTETERMAAEEDVEEIQGVRQIINTIVVAPGPPRADQDIAGDIRLALLAKELLGPSEIEVVVDNGIVTLRGSVWTAKEREDTAEIARRTDGVIEVVNLIRIID